ncbi:beta-glucuronidase-like isoform X2 [Sitophilus oryzae]|uniref:Beta-glucuronidase n=1 Tax=Sitophilus oryzae TaxID=7048 RepID=A0A6J2XLC3_SITOR|nr:beta-glucuronidase-like isoform X2 [Sitophilus oryzae]
MNIISTILYFCLYHVVKGVLHKGGILYPRESETRQIQSLDGLWNFVVMNNSNPVLGFKQHWHKKSLRELDLDVQLMPVPSSYNDITTDWQIRDHVGLVWYERTFFVPKFWSEIGRVWLRFESVSYAAQVWINGQQVMIHEIGHLPFLAEITAYLRYGLENRITVSCDNTLLPDTVPQGYVKELQNGRLQQTYTFDFYNYAGIDRPVKLYTTPKTYIDDITVITLEATPTNALLQYNVSVIGDYNVTCRVTLVDKNKNVVTGQLHSPDFFGSLRVENPKLWWPYLMNPEPGYLYSLEVELLDSYGDLVDKYIQPVGIRTLTWTNKQLLINSKPVYLHGFGRHEDSDIRGKGLDLPLIIRDHNLIKWIGANAYRTSHYPYAEEIMDLADQMGIMIIDECPSVNTEIFSNSMLVKHQSSLTQLIQRDKNRPAVIIWSAANEPRTQYPAAKEYFRQIIQHIKNLDTTRPTTIVEAQGSGTTQASEFVDIVSFNRYNAWYSNEGNLDLVIENVVNEATSWNTVYNKPVIMQEYGGDTMAGLHFLPNFIWSEEYQVGLLSRHFQAFDFLKIQGFFIGEFIWNFADFKTAQDYKRVGGNKKGIFTRNRQPKSSAHLLRKRYWYLAKEYNNNLSLPDDLENYIIASKTLAKQEL